MPNRAQTLDQLNNIERDLDLALAETRMDAVAHPASGWTVKDVIAHCNAWSWHMLRSVQAHANGGDWSLPAFNNERYNWQFYREALAMPASAVLAEWRTTLAEARALLGKYSDDVLAQQARAPWGSDLPMVDLIADIAGHMRGHLAEIKATRGLPVNG
jgi:hypothetical protein